MPVAFYIKGHRSWSIDGVDHMIADLAGNVMEWTTEKGAMLTLEEASTQAGAEDPFLPDQPFGDPIYARGGHYKSSHFLARNDQRLTITRRWAVDHENEFNNLSEVIGFRCVAEQAPSEPLSAETCP